MRSLTARERDLLPLDGPEAVLTKDEAETLSRLPLPPGAITWEHRAVRLGPFCGVLRVHDLTIEVLPKVAGVGDGTRRGVLVAMLRDAGHLATALPKGAGLAWQEQHLLDVFVLDFCAAASALLRQGAIRRYEEREERLPALRGRLHLSEHLRRGALEPTRLSCRFDELTADNAHNRALKAVLAVLFGHARGTRARAASGGLLHRLEEVADRPHCAADLDRLHFDRLTTAWEPLFRRAAALLRGLYPDVRAGVAVDGSCLLFDMQRLFEAFVGERLRRACPVGSGRVMLQGPRRALAWSETGPAFGMRPDFAVLAPDGRVLRILDAKWKQLEPGRVGVGVSQSDAYQMAAYAGGYGCGNLTLLYPAGDGVPAGWVEGFVLQLPGQPQADVHALDLGALARGAPLPSGLLAFSNDQITVVT